MYYFITIINTIVQYKKGTQYVRKQRIYKFQCTAVLMFMLCYMTLRARDYDDDDDDD